MAKVIDRGQFAAIDTGSKRYLIPRIGYPLLHMYIEQCGVIAYYLLFNTVAPTSGLNSLSLKVITGVDDAIAKENFSR